MNRTIVLALAIGTLICTSALAQTDRQYVNVLSEIEASGNFAPMFPFQPTHNAPDNLTNVRTWPGVDNRVAGADGFISI